MPFRGLRGWKESTSYFQPCSKGVHNVAGSVPERKPRTECGCQPVAFISSLPVAPSGRFSSSRTLAVLLPSRTPPAALACLAVFLALGAFSAGVAFFPALSLPGATRRACALTLAVLVAFG